MPGRVKETVPKPVTTALGSLPAATLALPAVPLVGAVPVAGLPPSE